MVSGHLAVLNRQKRAQALVVVDLSEEDNNKELADGEDVVLLTEEEKNGGQPPASAPPPPSVSTGAPVSYAPVSTVPGPTGSDILVLPPSQPQPSPYAPQPGVYDASPSAPSAPDTVFIA